MKRFLVPVLVGILLAVFSFALSVFSVGACHCVTPTTIFFPYAALVFGLTSWDPIGVFLLAVQFPLYALIVANMRGSGWRALIFLGLLAFHTAALLLGLKVYHH
jgi:hypothetical protein